jgi:thiamine transport system permease protein
MIWRRRVGWCTLAAIPLAVVAVFFVLPLGGMLHRGLWPEGHLDLGAVGDVLGRRRIRRVLWFTVWSSGLATLITVLLGVPVAWVLYRLRFPGRGLLRVIVAVPFVLPTVVVGVAFRTLFVRSGPLGLLGLDGTSTAIVVVLVFFNIAVVVRTIGAAWAGLDRRTGEAAAGLGASRARVFASITFPALRPAIVSSAVVVFLFCATAFGVVLTLGGLRYATIETEIYLQTTQFLDLRAAATLSLVQLLLVAVLLTLTSRARPVASEAEFSAEHRPRARDSALLVLTGAVAVFLAAPVVELVLRSVRRDGAWTSAAYRALGGQVWSALRNSLTTALLATAASIALALLASAVVSRTPRTRASRRALRALDAVFTLRLASRRSRSALAS